MRTTPAILGAIAVTALCAAGCSGSGHGTASPTAPSAGAPSAGAPQSASAAPSGTGGQPSPAAPGSPPQQTMRPVGTNPCATSSLQVKVGPNQGAAGSVYLSVDFTNISQATCTLYGYPGVSLAAGSPAEQVGLPAAQSGTHPRQVVTLKPGATASALLRITNAGNYPASTCGPQRTSQLRVYPPNQTASVLVKFASEGCSKGSVRTLTVDVVRPGAGDGSPAG